MTVRYVGVGGNNSNDGLSWANRKATLTGAEDTPVQAGDLVYVGPGVYREQLTVDVSGTNGNPITYIADVTGEHTDGVGGTVRITGSDNDTATARNNCITATTKDYRTFRGFWCGFATQNAIVITDCDYWIIEDFAFDPLVGVYAGIAIGSTSTNITIRRCVFMCGRAAKGIGYSHTSVVDNAAHTVEGCIFAGGQWGILNDRIGGITVKNCTFYMVGDYGIRVQTALTVGQTVAVNNCIFFGASIALRSTTATELAEDYNAFFANTTDRNTTATGANSVNYPPLFAPAMLLSGIRYPQPPFGALSEWSPVRAIAGTGELATDIFGVGRPATAAKNSWGAVQYVEPRRDTGTKRTGAASIKLPDASRHQLFVPTTNASTTFSVYVYWGADYTGTKPQLIVKQPGQSDQTDTATGSAETWEELSITLTPAAAPGYCVVELVSNNTATSGAYATYFDDLTIT